MKVRLVSVLLLICLSVFAKEVTGLVIRVADGDTLTLRDASGEQHKIRLWGIDAPESKQSMGGRSGKELSTMTLRKNVRVDVVNRDRYGREVGKVYVEDLFVNLEMIQRGYAWYYKDYAKNEVQFQEAENQARAGKLGIWSEDKPQPPWEFRREKRTSGNKKKKN